MSERLLTEAEAILAHAQALSPRLTFEAQIKDALRTTYPYSVSATEIGERLGIPWAHQILGYFALFGEVEKTGQGRYRHRTQEEGT